MTAYTAANFTPDILPGGFKREAIAAVVYAVHMGWTMTLRRQVAHLSSPVGDKHLALGPRSRNENFSQIYRTIDKYASPLIPTPPTEDAPVKEKEDWVEKNAKIAADNVKLARQKEDEKVTNTKVTLVKEGPMISKGGTLGGYTSNIANQREWSDGTIDYTCTRCGQAGTSPRGMASHWGKHVREDERARGGHKGVEVPVDRPSYQPTEERLNSLAEALIAALTDGQWSDNGDAARQLALAALTWDHERRNANEPGIREPLSDTEILNKIRGLVDNGLYESQEFAIVDLQARVDDAEARAVAAEAQVETMRANLTAFMGMMVEEFKVDA